jgi:hypothetical protein
MTNTPTGGMADVRILTVIAVLVIIMLAGCQNSSPGLVTVSYPGQVTAGITLNITQPQDESVVRSSPVTVSGTVPSGIEVMVNGISVSMENNRFSAMVELEAGPNMIEVLARDPAGKEIVKYLNIVYVP